MRVRLGWSGATEDGIQKVDVELEDKDLVGLVPDRDPGVNDAFKLLVIEAEFRLLDQIERWIGPRPGRKAELRKKRSALIRRLPRKK